MRIRCDECRHVEEAYATGYFWLNASTQLENGLHIDGWRLLAICVCSEFCAAWLPRENRVRILYATVT